MYKKVLRPKRNAYGMEAPMFFFPMSGILLENEFLLLIKCHLSQYMLVRDVSTERQYGTLTDPRSVH